MVIVQVDEAPVFTQTGALAYRLTLEGGGQRSGLAVHVGDGLVRIAPIDRHGYHNLLIGNSSLVVAVYPRRCPYVEALTGLPPVRCWGVAAQVHGLRGPDSGHYSPLARLDASAGKLGP